MIKMGMRAVGFSAVMTMFDKARGQYRINGDYYVGTNVDYGAYVEYGTWKMAAQPYLRPAAKSVQGNLQDHFARNSSGDAVLKSVALEVESKAKRNCPVDTGNLRGSIKTWKG